MSITSDIRGYADSAVAQGRAVVTDILGQAQAQLGDLTGRAGDLSTRASGVVNDLRLQAEKAVNVDAIKAAVEPYLAQARQYRTGVTDRADDLYAAVRNDKRVGKVVTTAEQVAGVVVGTVQERVVQPVLSRTDRGTPAGRKPAARKTTSTAARKPATTRPATKTTSTGSSTASGTKSAPRKSSGTTARKSTAKKAPATKSAPKA